MKKIRNYNPNLGLTLNDLELITSLEPKDVDAVIRTLMISAYAGEMKHHLLDNKEQRVIYGHLVGKVLDQTDGYDNYLIDKCGYTQGDIDEFHKVFKPQSGSKPKREYDDCPF